MKLALCNEVLGGLSLEAQCELAARLGYDGLEIAPFTLANAPERIDAAEARRIRGVVEAAGLVVTGLHWLLVKPSGLSVTDPDPARRRRTLDVVTRLIGLCAELGGKVLVHGSPKQRGVAAGETLDIARARLRDFPPRRPRPRRRTASSTASSRCRGTRRCSSIPSPRRPRSCARSDGLRSGR